MLLVGIGDRRVQHHRSGEPVAVADDLGRRAARPDGNRVRDRDHVLGATPNRSSTARRTNSLGTATRRLPFTAAGTARPR